MESKDKIAPETEKRMKTVTAFEKKLAETDSMQEQYHLSEIIRSLKGEKQQTARSCFFTYGSC